MARYGYAMLAVAVALLTALALRAFDLIGGPHGAAALLGLKRTTLQGRMRKLGISPA